MPGCPCDVFDARRAALSIAPGDPKYAMRLRPIFDILRARRLVVLTTMVSCLVGGAFVVLTAIPRYQATAEVALDYLKPNPVTGTMVTSKTVSAYVNSQLEMLRDNQVAIPAAEALGMLDSPDLQAIYAAAPDAAVKDPDGFQRWVARQIIMSTGVRPIPDSNILEISSISTSSERALATVEAVRTAYVQGSVTARRLQALGGASNLTSQANRTRAELLEFETAKRLWQDQNGFLSAQDASRLMELVTSVTPLYVQDASENPSGARLRALEAELEQATKTLGPNHPRLGALRTARDLLKNQFERETALAAGAGSSVALSENAKRAAIDVQKERVLSQRQNVLSLRLIEDQIGTRQDELKSLDKKIAELRQKSAMREADIASVGDPTVKPNPVFPNPLLSLGGAGFLGIVIGSLLALFVELLNRLARSARDLELSVGAALLGVVPTVTEGRRRGLRFPGATRVSHRNGRKAVA